MATTQEQMEELTKVKGEVPENPLGSSLIDPIVKTVQEGRIRFNQDPKAYPSINTKGQFDNKKAWLEVTKQINQSDNSEHKELVENLKTRYGDNWALKSLPEYLSLMKDVGGKINFDENSKRVEATKPEFTLLRPLDALREGVVANVRGLFDIASLVGQGINAVEDIHNTSIDERLIEARQDWVSHTKPVFLGAPLGGSPVTVEMPLTKDEKYRILNRIHRRYKDEGGDLSLSELSKFLESDQYGDVDGLGQGIVNFAKEHSPNYYTSDFSLETDYTVGDVEKFQIGAEMALPGVNTLLKRSLTRHSLKNNIDEKKYGRNVFGNIPVNKYFLDGISDTRALSFLNSKKASSPLTKAFSFIFDPIIRPVLVANDAFKLGVLDDLGKNTRRRSIAYVQDNPKLAKEIAFMTIGSMAAGEFLDQTLTEYHYSIPLVTQTKLNTELGTFGLLGGTLATFMGTPMLANLATDMILKGGGIHFARFLNNGLSPVLKSMSGFAGTFENVDSSFKLSTMLDRVEQLSTWSVDALEAGQYGISADWYHSLPDPEKEEIRHLLRDGNDSISGRKVRSFMQTFVKEMRKKNMNNPEAMLNIFNTFKYQVDIQAENAKFLRSLTNKNGERKFSDQDIEAYTTITLGQALGLPFFKGIDELMTTGGQLPFGVTKSSAREILGPALNDASIRFKSEQEKFAVITDAMFDQIEEVGGFERMPEQLREHWTDLKNYVAPILDDLNADIAERTTIFNKVEANTKEAKGNINKELTQDSEDYIIDARDTDQVNLDISSTFHNRETHGTLIDNTAKLDSRVISAVDSDGYVSPNTRAKWTRETSYNNDVGLGSMIESLMTIKNSMYGSLYRNSEGGPIFMSTRQFNQSVQNYKEANNINISGFKFKPKSYKISGGEGIVINKEAVDSFVKQGTARKNKLTKELQKEGITDKRITEINDTIAAIDNKIENIKELKSGENYLTDPKVSESIVKSILDNDKFGFFSYELYQLEDIQRLANQSNANLNNRTLGSSIREFDDLGLANDVLGENNLKRIYGDEYNNFNPDLIKANEFYRDFVSPIIKTKIGKKYQRFSNLGQQGYLDKDLFLELFEQVEPEVLGNIFKRLKDDGNLNFKLLDDTVITGEEFPKFFIQSLKNRIVEKSYLNQNINVNKLQENFEALIDDPIFKDHITTQDINTILSLGEGAKKIDSGPSVAEVRKAAVMSTQRRRFTKDIELSFAGKIEDATSAKDFFRNLNLTENELEKTAAFTQAGRTETKTLTEEIRGLNPENKEAFKQTFYDYITEDFIGFNRDTLELTSVTSAGQQLQVPKLFLAMYKNEELFIEILGEETFDQLANLTAQMINKADQGTSRISVGRETKPLRQDLTGQRITGVEGEAPSIADNMNKFYQDEVNAGRIQVDSMGEFGGTTPVQPFGVPLEAGTQVISSRFFNVARGLVSPQFVGLEFMLKSIPKNDFAVLTEVFRNPTSTKVINDMFFEGNFTSDFGKVGWGLREVRDAKAAIFVLLTGLTPEEDVAMYDDGGLFDLSTITENGSTRLATKLEIQKELESMRTNLDNMSNEDLAEFLNALKAEGVLNADKSKLTIPRKKVTEKIRTR